jgi:D-alanine-D-alanine ligase
MAPRGLGADVVPPTEKDKLNVSAPGTTTPASPAPAQSGPRTLGPISDLERHLPAEWWRTLFNAVYLKTDGDVVENHQNTIQDISRMLELTGLGPEAEIVDLCCGQGRHAIELGKRGFARVTGVDRSRYLVRLARRRGQKMGLNIGFKEGDARKFRYPPASADCVTLFGNSFGYFERAEDDVAVLRAVRRILKPAGSVVLDLVDGAWMRQNFEPRTWEWIDQTHFVCRERAIASDGHRLISREVVTHAEKGVIADQFYAERLYTFEEIRALLARMGFVEIRREEAPSSLSDRNQDLGMMAHRMFIIARAPAAISPAARRGPFLPKVTVILGDPSMPDLVKRGGQFNVEDFDTINRLKAALGELREYSFSYFNDHAGLIDFLRKERPQFILNLCDEGYKNDAFKELHIPALFEMLGIPYSGAGPSALGLCYNKSYVRAIAEPLDIPVPLETFHGSDDQAATLPSIFPVLLKPNVGDSSLGITKDSVVSNQQEFMAYWEHLRAAFPDRDILVQEFLNGQEYTVGIIGNPGMQMTILPVLEVDYSGLDSNLPRILGYESKWDPESPYWSEIKYHEAKLSEQKKRTLIDRAQLLFERLDCRDYARFDFRADANGEIKLLEANPNPGWCWDGKMNIMAGYAGMTYADMLRLILDAAQARFALAPQAAIVAMQAMAS